MSESFEGLKLIEDFLGGGLGAGPWIFVRGDFELGDFWTLDLAPGLVPVVMVFFGIAERCSFGSTCSI